jgi:hypothetical protein
MTNIPSFLEFNIGYVGHTMIDAVNYLERTVPRTPGSHEITKNLIRSPPYFVIVFRMSYELFVHSIQYEASGAAGSLE